MKRLAIAAAALALSGCATSIVLPAAPNATLDPRAFFTGRTHGEGELKIVGRSQQRITVDSVGRPQGEGLVLDQTIQGGGKAPRTRRWTMRPVGPNLYSGTLTDAAGPVSVRVQGPRAYIAYTMHNGMKVDQQLALQADGKTILNHLVVRKFGLALAELNETIAKVDAPR
jgi:hypothetical protein